MHYFLVRDGIVAFFDEVTHGLRQINVVDQAKQDAAMARAAEKDNADFEAALKKRRDDEPEVIRSAYQARQRAQMDDPVMQIVSNPDCRIPAEARPIEREAFVALMEAQTAGKQIVADAKGELLAVDPVATPDQIIEQARVARDKALAATDWTQIPDAMSEAKRKLWAEHRKALRDLPAKLKLMTPADLKTVTHGAELLPQAPK